MIDRDPTTDVAHDPAQAVPSYAKDGASPRQLARTAGALYLIKALE